MLRVWLEWEVVKQPMDAHLVEFLKAVAEGKDAGANWHRWFAKHEPELGRALPRGSFLRLNFHPLNEAKAILQQQGIPFEASERFHWLPGYVVDGKCCVCGEQIERRRSGSFWCPNGCFPRLMV